MNRRLLFVTRIIYPENRFHLLLLIWVSTKHSNLIIKICIFFLFFVLSILCKAHKVVWNNKALLTELYFFLILTKNKKEIWNRIEETK